jgi:hypothetical protein
MNPHESLTAEEESALRRHPTIGAQVIEPLDRTMSSSDSLCSIIMHRMMEAVIPAGGVQCRFRLGLALSGALML